MLVQITESHDVAENKRQRQFTQKLTRRDLVGRHMVLIINRQQCAICLILTYTCAAKSQRVLKSIIDMKFKFKGESDAPER